MSEKIVVCLEKGGARDMAEAFSRRTNTPIAEKPGEHLTVLFNSKGVSLTGYGLTYQGDFENMLHRVTNGRLQHEMLVRASKSEKPGRKAIDATAGMGEDGFLLAAQGYEVTLYEQNPVIAVLLKDALLRAKKHPVLKEIAARMKLAEGNGGINACTPGSCRRHLPGSHVPRKTEVQPDQQKTAAHPEAGAPMLPRDRPFRRRYQRRPR